MGQPKCVDCNKHYIDCECVKTAGISTSSPTGQVDSIVMSKNFLNDLKALLSEYNAEIVAEDHWAGYAECGQDIRMTVEFEDCGMEDLDLGRYVDKEKNKGNFKNEQ